MGRKSKYETHVEPYLKDIPHWYEDMTEGQIAKKLGITPTSFENYKKKHKALQAALKKGKQYLADDLKDALRQKALGFVHVDEKTTKTTNADGKTVVKTISQSTFYPPDVAAINLLLKNIDPDWHNDDVTTIDLRREELDLKKQKAESESWT